MYQEHRTHFDWSIVWATGGLVFIGLLNLYSATLEPAGAVGRYFVLQLTYVVMGVVVAAVCIVADYRVLERFAYFLYVVMIASLVGVMFFGSVHQGSRSWIDLGPVNWQPMEFGKLGLIIVLAKHFHENQKSGKRLRDLWTAAFLVALPVGLLVTQPDLGGALLYVAIAASILLYVGLSRFSFASLFLSSLLSFPLIYKFGLTERQQDRIRVFLDPELDPLGKGYNAIQSKIAIGSGQLIGRGYLSGTQSKLKFLPAHHTDFVFSVLAEEWGFLGCSVVLVLLFGFLMFGVRIVHRAKDRFGAILAFGVVVMFFWQIFVNIGGALGVLPVTGVTLPFMSYGGSSLIMNFAAVGLLLNVGMRRFMF